MGDLPVHRVAGLAGGQQGLAPGGHGIVGAAQGGTAALALAEFYPNRFRYAGSLSGFLYPSNTFLNGALHAGMMQFGGVDTNLMWGPAQAGGSGTTRTCTTSC